MLWSDYAFREAFRLVDLPHRADTAVGACCCARRRRNVVLDYDILGRDAEGWQVLYKTPELRYAVDVFHAAIVYLLPPALAVGFLALGRKLRVRTLWILFGGVLVSIAGSVHVIEAAWTGVRGTSGLRIGLVDDGLVVTVRLIANLAFYAIAFFVIGAPARR